MRNYDPYSSMNQNSYGQEINNEILAISGSERSFTEKDNMLANLRDQLEREKYNSRQNSDKNESLMIEKAELLHKISQLQQMVKEKENYNSGIESELSSLKTKHEELINSQYANASEKLNMLALELESKDEEIKTIVQEKNAEVQELKTVLDAKQAIIAKSTVQSESKETKIKSLEKQIKNLESELKAKSKEIASFEFSTKHEMEHSVVDKTKEINELKHELAMKRTRILKQEQRLADLTKELDTGKFPN